MSLLVLGVLLVLPALAIQRLFGENRMQAAYYAIAISVITFISYARDKRRAQTAGWRVSEARLHLLEMMGGWPGAWLAQRYLRHKCSKRSYQITFLIIILIHQFVAYDFLQDWRGTIYVMQVATDLQSSGLPTLDEFKTSFLERWWRLLPSR